MNKLNMTTLCYIENEDSYLMMHRVKKENDLNKDKWVGIGGHFEDGESPEECLIREALEESGLALTSYTPRGFITFVSDEWGTEYMHLYTADGYEAANGTDELPECSEGELCWVPKEEVYDLPLWEGDKIFFRLLETRRDYFFLKLEYQGDTLVKATLDGREIAKI